MRALPIVLMLLGANPSRAAEPPHFLTTWKPNEYVWGLWGGLVLAQGITLLIPGGGFLAASYDNAQLARAFPGGASQQRIDDQAMIGGIFIGFAVTAILTAAFMFVYQARGTWHEDAYWQSR